MNLVLFNVVLEVGVEPLLMMLHCNQTSCCSTSVIILLIVGMLVLRTVRVCLGCVAVSAHAVRRAVALPSQRTRERSSCLFILSAASPRLCARAHFTNVRERSRGRGSIRA